MEEKDRPAADIDARENDDANAPGGRIYDIDSDSAAPVEGEEGEEAVAPEGEAPQAGGRFKISKKQILDRFAEKNSAITKLQKEKNAAEKERDSVTAEKAALEGQVREFKDKWLRSAAEFENYRKRTAKEWELLKQQSRTEVILEILASLDDFERAFAVVEPGDESDFVKGIRLIHGNLVRVLQKLGVAEVDALHQPFDPNRHMAIGQIETTDTPSGHVAQVITKGYILNGSVIRPAHVIVAK